MTKKLFILFIVLLKLNSAMAQNQTEYLLENFREYQGNDSVRKYYEYVHKAEWQVINSNYQKASRFYEKAFSYLEYPFSMDVNNALKCEFSGDKNELNIKRYVYLNVNKSGNKSSYTDDKKYQELTSFDQITQMIDTIVPSFDTVLEQELVNILEYDQGYRRQCNLKYGSTYNEFTEDSIAFVDSVNYYKIIEIVKSKNYISEEIIGSRGWRNIEVVLMHNRDRYEIYDVLLKSVLMGKFDARKYARSLSDASYLIENENPVAMKGNGFQINNKCYLFVRPTIRQKIKTRKLWDLLYIENPKDFHQKRTLQLQNKTNGFIFYPTDNFVFPDQYLFQYIIDSRKDLKTKMYYKDKITKKQLLKEARDWKKEQKKTKKEDKE